MQLLWMERNKSLILNRCLSIIYKGSIIECFYYSIEPVLYKSFSVAVKIKIKKIPDLPFIQILVQKSGNKLQYYKNNEERK